MGETASLAFMGASTGSKAAGSYLAGQRESDIERYNADLANFSASDAIVRGNQEAANHSLSVAKLLGAQRAALAAQGVDVNQGTPADLQVDTAEMAARDESTIRLNALREAFGYRVQAAGHRNRAKMARLSGLTGAAGEILSGVGKGYGVHDYFNDGLKKKNDSLLKAPNPNQQLRDSGEFGLGFATR